MLLFDLFKLQSYIDIVQFQLLLKVLINFNIDNNNLR